MEGNSSQWLARSVVWKSREPLAGIFRGGQENGGKQQPVAGEIGRLEIKGTTG